MGYEIQFKFFKKKSEGFGYETDGEPETMKIAVGKQWDDVDLDEVAKSVFGQMAKRNILIVDAEIYEYAKKKISFKMKDDGISIKNRKFSYDITGAIKSEEESAGLAQPVVQNGQMLHPHQYIQQSTQMVPVGPQQQDITSLAPEVQAEILKMRQDQVGQKIAHPGERLRAILPPQGQPLRYEVYDPHPDLLRVAQAKKLPFSLGRKYPIYEEKPDKRGTMFGMVYLTEDDQGNRRALNDKHFVPLQNLTNNFDSETGMNHVARVAVDSNQAVVDGKTMNLPDIYTLGRRR
jgi:hypothetical protein